MARWVLADDGTLTEGTTRPAPTVWATLDDHTYEATTAATRGLGRVAGDHLHHRSAHDPASWADHPDLITELGALHDAWRAAYHPTSDASRPAAWLDDLPARLQRIRERSTAHQGHPRRANDRQD